jgi:phosphoenolpyruvate-protein kinase (PTS system EI component)
VEIVLPMVAAVEEVREAKTVISRISRNLVASGEVSAASVPVGAMIEVPAAVIALETLAGEVDFLCVGTNDLIQYLLAVDRANPQVAHLFRPLHPAMLHSLQRIATVAGNSGKPVRICGEMCANPFFAILLIGMGFTELSMNSMSIPTVRRLIRETTMAAAAALSRRALEFSTASEVAEFLLREVTRLSTADLSPYVKEVAGATPPLVSGAATGAPAG